MSRLRHATGFESTEILGLCAIVAVMTFHRTIAHPLVNEDVYLLGVVGEEEEEEAKSLGSSKFLMIFAVRSVQSDHV